MRELAARIAAFFRSRFLDAEFSEEIDSHLALLEEEQLRKGIEPGEARRTARLLLGGRVGLNEAHRDARGLPDFDSLLRDIRYALRSLRKSPGFAFAAILTLALGIGANTAIFSTIDETLFRPLDFPHPGELADIFSFNKSSQMFVSSSYPDFEDYRARAKTFRQLGAFLRMFMMVALPPHAGRIQRLPVESVTGNFFSMLGLPAAAGRAFSDSDDIPLGPRVAMLSEEIADARAIGETIQIEDQPFTVIGIVPKRYHGTNLNWGDPPRVWIPLHAIETVQPRIRVLDAFHKRSIAWLLITGRLNPGFTAAQAQSEIQTIAAGIAQNSPSTSRNITASVFEASRSKFWPSYRTLVERSLMVFAVAAGLVLLLTCANLSSLLLNRAVARKREFAIRLSIGASRGRVIRQLMTESILLALPGCLAGLGVAYGLSRLIAHFPNAFSLNLALDAPLDYRVLGFCIALSLSTTLLFGLAPALEATRTDVLPTLKASGNSVTSGGGDWLRNSLLIVQLAFTMILLIGGTLFGRSVMQAWAVNLGFRTENLLTANFNSPQSGAAAMQRMQRDQEELLRLVRATPGVRAAALAWNRPLPGPGNLAMQVRSGTQTAPATRQAVGPGFFNTLGIALRRGRDFNAGDTDATPKVAIVTESLAAKLWPGADPVGRTLSFQNDALQVVGTVPDFRYSDVWGDPQPSMFIALSQVATPAMHLIVRTDVSPAALVAPVTREWESVQPRWPFYEFRTGDELMSLALAPQRIAAGIFGCFGVLAVVLACVGLYSSVAYRVARRTREIGIRMAVGATPGIVLRQILWQSSAIAGIGIVAGSGAGALLTRFVAGQVKGVGIHDSSTFILAAALLGVVALLAAAAPARRACRIDPQTALRSE